jgi:hypothetical protein
MRVFSNSFSRGCTLGRSWAVEEAQEQVNRNTPVSRTPTVAPGSPARERTLLRGRRAGGPQKLLGPPTARVNYAVRGPCEDAEVVGTWRPCSRRNEAAWGSCVVGGVTGVFQTVASRATFRKPRPGHLLKGLAGKAPSLSHSTLPPPLPFRRSCAPKASSLPILSPPLAPAQSHGTTQGCRSGEVFPRCTAAGGAPARLPHQEQPRSPDRPRDGREQE